MQLSVERRLLIGREDAQNLGAQFRGIGADGRGIGIDVGFLRRIAERRYLLLLRRGQVRRAQGVPERLAVAVMAGMTAHGCR